MDEFVGEGPQVNVLFAPSHDNKLTLCRGSEVGEVVGGKTGLQR